MFLFILIFLLQEFKKNRSSSPGCCNQNMLVKKSLFSGGSVLRHWKGLVNCLLPTEFCNGMTTWGLREQRTRIKSLLVSLLDG